MSRRTIWPALAGVLAIAVQTASASNVPENAVAIKVGQELLVQFTPSGDSLVSPKVVPEGSRTEPVVTVQLTQNGPSRSLLITNGFAKSLSYRAVARIRGRRREVELPVVSVRSGLQSVVTLGEPFDELILFEFHLQG